MLSMINGRIFLERLLITYKFQCYIKNGEFVYQISLCFSYNSLSLSILIHSVAVLLLSIFDDIVITVIYFISKYVILGISTAAD